MKAKNIILKVLPHVTTVISFMFLTFCIIDMQNSAMAFLDNPITRALLMVFSVVTVVINCVIYAMPKNTSANTAAAKPTGMSGDEKLDMLIENQRLLAENVEILTKLHENEQAGRGR